MCVSIYSEGFDWSWGGIRSRCWGGSRSRCWGGIRNRNWGRSRCWGRSWGGCRSWGGSRSWTRTRSSIWFLLALALDGRQSVRRFTIRSFDADRVTLHAMHNDRKVSSNLFVAPVKLNFDRVFQTFPQYHFAGIV